MRPRFSHYPKLTAKGICAASAMDWYWYLDKSPQELSSTLSY